MARWSHSPTGADPFSAQIVAGSSSRPVRLRHWARTFANELARSGVVVLAHDVFIWGGRRFPLEAMPESVLQRAQDYVTARAAEGRTVDEIERYNVAASHHEHVVAKYGTVLGGTLAGVVALEDRVAVGYLRSRPEVDGERIGFAGLSGGAVAPQCSRRPARRSGRRWWSG